MPEFVLNGWKPVAGMLQAFFIDYFDSLAAVEKRFEEEKEKGEFAALLIFTSESGLVKEWKKEGDLFERK